MMEVGVTPASQGELLLDPTLAAQPQPGASVVAAEAAPGEVAVAGSASVDAAAASSDPSAVGAGAAVASSSASASRMLFHQFAVLTFRHEVSTVLVSAALRAVVVGLGNGHIMIYAIADSPPGAGSPYTLRLARVLTGHISRVTALAIDVRRNLLISISSSGCLSLFDLRENATHSMITSVDGFRSLVYEPELQLIMVTTGKSTVNIYDATQQPPTLVHSVHVTTPLVPVGSSTRRASTASSSPPVMVAAGDLRSLSFDLPQRMLYVAADRTVFMHTLDIVGKDLAGPARADGGLRVSSVRVAHQVEQQFLIRQSVLDADRNLLILVGYLGAIAVYDIENPAAPVLKAAWRESDKTVTAAQWLPAQRWLLTAAKDSATRCYSFVHLPGFELAGSASVSAADAAFDATYQSGATTFTELSSPVSSPSAAAPSDASSAAAGSAPVPTVAECQSRWLWLHGNNAAVEESPLVLPPNVARWPSYMKTESQAQKAEEEAAKKQEKEKKKAEQAAPAKGT
jgi:hypothetical protein